MKISFSQRGLCGGQQYLPLICGQPDGQHNGAREPHLKCIFMSPADADMCGSAGLHLHFGRVPSLDTIPHNSRTVRNSLFLPPFMPLPRHCHILQHVRVRTVESELKMNWPEMNAKLLSPKWNL